MSHSCGFTDPEYPIHMCKLHKTLCGFKNTPHAWFEKLSSKLLELNFIPFKFDTYLFIHNCEGHVTIVLVYVDDLNCTGSSNKFISSLILQLSNAFSIKDLGKLHYFLGIEVYYKTIGLTLSQSKYIKELLVHSKLDGANAICTPMVTWLQLSQLIYNCHASRCVMYCHKLCQIMHKSYVSFHCYEMHVVLYEGYHRPYFVVAFNKLLKILDLLICILGWFPQMIGYLPMVIVF